MRSSRKNFTKDYQIVKSDFQNCVSGLFEKEYHGSKCNNRICINVLFAHFAASSPFSLQTMFEDCLFRNFRPLLLNNG